MSHSKRSVKVVSSLGERWTSKRGARRLLGSRMAEELPNGTLRMFEGDHRFNSESKSANGPQLRMKGNYIPTEGEKRAECVDCHRPWVPDGTWETCTERNGVAA